MEVDLIKTQNWTLHSPVYQWQENMLERVLSARRGAQFSEEVDDDDESKTRKHISLAMRATNFLTRTGYLWPLVVLAFFLIVIFSVFMRSRDLVCVSSVSSFDRLSRTRFFGLDGLESDFRSLGVPWFKLSYYDVGIDCCNVGVGCCDVGVGAVILASDRKLNAELYEALIKGEHDSGSLLSTNSKGSVTTSDHSWEYCPTYDYLLQG